MFGESKQDSQSRVVSLQLAVARQTRRRSLQAVSSGRDVGGRGAPIVVSHCIATPSLFEIDASQQGQKPLNTEAEESMATQAITRQPVKTQQTEKT
jgi:hypothetical protein